MTSTPKRGGKRPGAGCPPKDPADKVVKCYISMTQAHHTATNGDRAGIIRRALDAYFKEQERVKRMRDVYNGVKEGRYELVADVSEKPFDLRPTFHASLTDVSDGVVSLEANKPDNLKGHED